MLQPLYICAALCGFPLNQLQAQQHEAMLQRVHVPGFAFDVIIALPKSGSRMIDLAKLPEAFGVALLGGELALTFESGEQMLRRLDDLRVSFGAFHIQDSCGKSLIPALMYIVPKDGPRDAAGRTTHEIGE